MHMPTHRPMRALFDGVINDFEAGEQRAAGYGDARRNPPIGITCVGRCVVDILEIEM